jgi:oligopeptide transport system permease protein
MNLKLELSIVRGRAGSMLKYSLKRLLQSILTLFIVLTVVFLLMRLLPEEGYFGSDYEKLDFNQREAILKNLGLRDPLYIQLGHFYKNLATGNLGTSIIYRPKVAIAASPKYSE